MLQMWTISASQREARAWVRQSRGSISSLQSGQISRHTRRRRAEGAPGYVTAPVDWAPLPAGSPCTGRGGLSLADADHVTQILASHRSGGWTPRWRGWAGHPWNRMIWSFRKMGFGCWVEKLNKCFTGYCNIIWQILSEYDLIML